MVSTEIWLTLAITAGALALFVWNRLRVEVVGLIVMACLIVVGLVTPSEGISGFSNEATFTVAAMLVLSEGLVRTGVLDTIAAWMGRHAKGSRTRLLVVTLIVTLPLSAFLNNTAVVAILLPVVMGLSRDLERAPSQLLMPLSFGSQLGGSLTLIGSSTNLLVAGVVQDLGLPPLSLFTMTPPALILAGVGVLYLLTLGRWLAPARKPPPRDLLTSYELREYATGLIVEPGSRLVGLSLKAARFGQQFGMEVVAIQRSGQHGRESIRFPSSRVQIREDDLLLVTGKVANIARVQETHGLRISGDRPELPLEGDGGRLVEAIVPPRSPLVGHTLQELDFRHRFLVTVLALQRHGVPLRERIGSIPLMSGDLLLIRGMEDELQEIHRHGHLALLGTIELPTRRHEKKLLAVGILVGVVLVPALGLAPIVVTSLIGSLAMILTGCLLPEEAYEGIDWGVILLLGSLLPLGLAMQRTGTASFLANSLVGPLESYGPYALLFAIYLATLLLTEVISNNATALVLTPIAVAVALAAGVSPLPFVIAVMLAASNSFMTPIGYQTNTFIYGPGGFRFIDFLRVGGPLGLVLLLVATLVIPWFYPFHP